MFLVVGLGNPGPQYKISRHNVGFGVIDSLVQKLNLFPQKKFNSKIYENFSENFSERIIFLKPLTFMNLSGEAVKKVMDFYKIDIEKLIVIHDDIAISFGKFKIKKRGRHAGHNGVRNIIENCKSELFIRIKIGINSVCQDESFEIKKFVLENFNKEELKILEKINEKANKAVVDIIKNGAEYAMNIYNSKITWQVDV